VALEGAEQFTVELTLPPGQPALQLGNNRQTTITITDNDGIHYRTAVVYNHQLLQCVFASLSAVVSVEFANRSIEVSEGVGEVTVCLLKNSTTAMDFNVTVVSVESFSVSAEGLHRNIGLNQYDFSLTLSLSYLLSLGGADFEEVSRTFSFPTRNDGSACDQLWGCTCTCSLSS